MPVRSPMPLHKPWLVFLLLLAAWGAAPSGHAQVTRCADPISGAVTYTDGECAAGERSRSIEARKSPEEIHHERAQAAQALEDKHKRRQTEALQQRLSSRTTAAPSASAPEPADSPACHQARQTLQNQLATLDPSLYDTPARLDHAERAMHLACLSPADYARPESRRPPYPGVEPPPSYAPLYLPPLTALRPRPHLPPPRRPDMLSCNVFRCYDKQGNSYPH